MIIVAVLAGLVVLGIGIKYGWDVFTGGSQSDPAYDELAKTGKLSGQARDAFVTQSVQACEKQRPDSVSAEAFAQYCSCASRKAADLITADEAKVISDTGQMPSSLMKKLTDPMKECVKTSGLLPAQ